MVISTARRWFTAVLVVACCVPSLLLAANDDDDRLLQEIDRLLAGDRATEAVELAGRLLASPQLEARNVWRAQQRLGAALVASNRAGEAVPLLETVIRGFPDDAPSHLNLGRALHQLGQRGRAVSEFAVAVALAPDRPRWRLEYAAVLQDMGIWRDALREINTARSLCGDCPDALLGAANFHLARNDSRQAVEPLAALYELDRKREVRERLAQAWWNAGEPDSALALLDSIPGAQLTPAEVMVLVQAERSLGRPRRALTWARAEANDLPPVWRPPADFWAMVAEICLATDAPELGLLALDRALAVSPESALLHHNRAAALVALGREDEARHALERARDLDAESKERP